MYKKIKELVKHLPTLHFPLESECQIIQIDANQTKWGGTLLAITNIGEEKLCRYYSGTFNDYQKNLSSTNLEIESIICLRKNLIIFKPRTIYFKNQLREY